VDGQNRVTAPWPACSTTTIRSLDTYYTIVLVQ
jgi:hypothetical protein